MALIETYSGGDKVLRLNNSEAIRTNVTVPVGCTDLRFGIVLGLAGAFTEQAFNPVVSRFESLRMLFTSSDVADPTGKFVGIGSAPGGVCFMRNNTCRLQFNTINDSGNVNWVVLGSGVSNSGATSAAVRSSIDNAGAPGTEAGMFMIRLFNDAGTLRLSFRIATGGGTSEGRGLISLFNSDSLFRSRMSDLSLTTQISTTVITGMTISEVTGVFFSWPFFNVSPRIHYLGYRAII